MYLHHVTAKYIIKIIAKTTFFFCTNHTMENIMLLNSIIYLFIYLHHVTAKYIMNVIVGTTCIY